MNKLSFDQVHFLTALSDGRTRTYVHFMKEMGMPLTPMSPTFVNNLARPLRKQGLVKQKLGGGYQITEAGLDALKEAALALARETLGQAATEEMGMTGEQALEILRRSFRR